MTEADDDGPNFAVPENPEQQELFESILASEETHRIAAALGMHVTDYAAKVLAFALDPELEPYLEVISDEDAARYGLATIASVTEFFAKVESGEINLDPRLRDAIEAKRAGVTREKLTGTKAVVKAPLDRPDPLKAARQQVSAARGLRKPASVPVPKGPSSTEER